MKKNYVFKNKKTMFNIDLTLPYEKIRTFLNKFYSKSLITIEDVINIYKDIYANYNYFDDNKLADILLDLHIKYIHGKPREIKIIYR